MTKISLRDYNQEIEAMIDRGQLDEAIAHCQHILKTFPKHLETYRLLGKAYLEYKRYPDAADVFSRVLVAVPDDFVANVGIGIIRDEENKLDEAIWHMEHAFEIQTSNVAIQSELRRLYGRRDGVQSPNIRMTHGALAQMYAQRELYSEAISEIKFVLQQDPNRTDMQTLLARVYYKNGLKNDAIDVASSILRGHPHCLDANRVLVEILGTDDPARAQVYRQRVAELDPYAAQVTSSIFSSSEVPNTAVMLERLDWKMAHAISPVNRQYQDEQQEWLKSGLGEVPKLHAGDTKLMEETPKIPSSRSLDNDPNENRSLRVFLCHSSNDKPVVRKLYHQLSEEAWIAPWLDEEKLDPGDRWNLEIKKAVKKSDIVIVCLSTSSINKEGFVQKEIKFALDVADEKPEDTIFIIPLRLEECTVPDRLSDWQWVNYYENGAYDRLLRSLRKRAITLGINTKKHDG